MAKIDRVQEVSLELLKPYENNAKIHGETQVKQIADSISEFGFLSPCLIDHDYNIIAGHGRVMAAKQLGMETVPCVFIEGLTDAQRRAYILADNRLTELGDWDFDKVQFELRELADMDFNVELTGFELEEFEEPKEIIEDDFTEDVEPITKLGDIWQLGRHRLICGDSTDPNVIGELMGDNRADLYLTDPPYNVDYTDGHDVERKILNDHFDSDEECGEQLWRPAFAIAREYAKDSCSMYCFMPQGGTHMMMMMMMMSEAGWQVKHELIWEKQSIVLNRADYNYQHEPIMYGWNKTHKFYGGGKYKNTSIWKFDRPTKSKEHPTMKPVELLGEILLNATQQGDVVLDTFGGSGSTLIACEQLDRTCFTCELDPHYCDVIVNRWENLSGEKAVRL